MRKERVNWLTLRGSTTLFVRGCLVLFARFCLFLSCFIVMRWSHDGLLSLTIWNMLISHNLNTTLNGFLAEGS